MNVSALPKWIRTVIKATVSLVRSSAIIVIDKLVAPIVRYVHCSAFSERAAQGAQVALRAELDDLRARIGATQPGNPCLQGFKVYSQVDEDGIIQEIFRRIPAPARTFIEIGSGDGQENNTHFLALLGWRGVWVDADEGSVARASMRLGGQNFESLRIRQMFVSAENLSDLLDHYDAVCTGREIGFFSIDIDGNDLTVLQAFLEHRKPQVVCAEYNAKFPPPLSFCVRYDENFRWAYDDYQGASLQAFCDGLPDYRLVCCNLNGANAFFVRRDLDAAFEAYSPDALYQPLRMSLSSFRPHHPASMKWLRDSLKPIGESEA
ncbi:MAG: FkbM family methyltransferase [Beijerinckiaceae bacterium]|nr:FkbM family methyltransferase [Beijerinckiaceae bacterium]